MRGKNSTHPLWPALAFATTITSASTPQKKDLPSHDDAHLQLGPAGKLVMQGDIFQSWNISILPNYEIVELICLGANKTLAPSILSVCTGAHTSKCTHTRRLVLGAMGSWGHGAMGLWGHWARESPFPPRLLKVDFPFCLEERKMP